MRHPRVLALTLAALALGTLARPLPAQTSGDPLDGTEWDLIAFRKSRPIPGTHFFIRFDDGRVTGNAGCNGFFASYAVHGDSITVTDIGAERMMCHEPQGLMEQESYLLRFLAEVRTLGLADDRLLLHRPDGEDLTFVPRPRSP